VELGGFASEEAEADGGGTEAAEGDDGEPELDGRGLVMQDAGGGGAQEWCSLRIVAGFRFRSFQSIVLCMWGLYRLRWSVGRLLLLKGWHGRTSAAVVVVG